MNDILKIIRNWTIFGLTAVIIMGIWTYIIIKAARSTTNPSSDADPASLYISAGDTLKATKRNALVDRTMACPSGFTAITNQWNMIWCIQNSLRPSTASCYNAMLDCYDTYGGRLASPSEIKIATTRYAWSLTDELTQREWIDMSYIYYDGTSYSYRCSWLKTDGVVSWGLYTDSQRYRCFIPR